jgi:PAS domain S-box-containing protein
MTKNSRASFTALVLATLLGPALLLAAMAWWSWDRVQRDTAITINRNVELLNEHARRLLQSDAIILDRVADRIADLSWPEIIARESELSRELENLVRGVGEVDGVFVADAQGEPQVSSRFYPVPARGAATPTSLNTMNRAYFQAAQKGAELVVDGPFIDPKTGRPIFDVVKRLSARDGSFRGTAVLVISPSHLTEFWRQVVLPGDSVSLVREDGIVLARYPEVPIGADEQPARFSKIAMDIMRSADVGQFDRTPSPIDGIARTLGYRKLPGYPLYVVDAVDRGNVLNEWYPSVLAFGMLALAAAVALFLTATAVIRRARSEEAALRRAEDSEANYRALYARTPVPMHACDRNGIVTEASDRWLELMGYARGEVIGRPITSFHTPGSAAALAKGWHRAIDVGDSRDIERQFVRKSGEILDVVISAQVERDTAGNFQRVLAFVTDVTAQRRTEAALRQAQRLEAVGQLTGGIAHDFNNLLLVINGNAEVLRAGVRDAEYVRALDAIDRASKRGERLTRQLLAFSRQQTLTPSVIDLSERLPRLREMLGGSLRGDIAVAFDVPTTIWPIEVDAGELELALLNIAVNARDAMPSGGEFVVSAKNVTLSKRSSPDRLAGDFIALTLTDTGEGIAPDDMAKVFEPFFTTKEVGRGTGLGLSQVYGFTKQSGGTATVSSEIRRGTAITLYLPRSRSQPAGVAADRVVQVPAGGNETILVVEDDPEVADVSRTLLQQLGYRTLLAGDARRALELLASVPAIDLVFSDVMMPGGMSGLELARTVRQRYPHLGVLLTTGYSGGAQEAVRAGLPLIAKPYQLGDLGRHIREILAQRGAPTTTRP